MCVHTLLLGSFCQCQQCKMNHHQSLMCPTQRCPSRLSHPTPSSTDAYSPAPSMWEWKTFRWTLTIPVCCLQFAPSVKKIHILWTASSHPNAQFALCCAVLLGWVVSCCGMFCWVGLCSGLAPGGWMGLPDRLPPPGGTPKGSVDPPPEVGFGHFWLFSAQSAINFDHRIEPQSGSPKAPKGDKSWIDGKISPYVVSCLCICVFFVCVCVDKLILLHHKA